MPVRTESRKMSLPISSFGILNGLPLPKREAWTSPENAPGVPKGAITEICGAGKTEWVVRFLKEHPILRVAWIEPELSIYPPALFQRAIDPNRILFIEGGDETPWVIQQLFKSALFEIIILLSTLTDFKILRRFQLAAEKAGASLILLSETFSKGWPVALQLKILRKEGGMTAEIIRKR